MQRRKHLHATMPMRRQVLPRHFLGPLPLRPHLFRTFRVLFCEKIDYLDTQPTNRMSDLHSDTPEPMPCPAGQGPCTP
jgi:hypothetical protein